MTTVTSPSAASQVASSTSSSSSQSTINAGLSSIADNYQTFLTLLTTQLQNQDPLSPMDTEQFTSQLTQMTGVEQQLLSNQLLQSLVASNQGNTLTGAVSLIGKSVSANGSSATLTSGQATWPYTLPSSATTASVQVLDSGGNVVFSGTLPNTTAGSYNYTWNGQTSSGTQLANGGAYTLKITAADANGNPISATDTVTGQVTQATQVNGVTMVTINGVQVPASTVDLVN